MCRDKKDNKILECAESADADYIVSGDDDLLSMNYKIPIIRTREALSKLQ